LLTAKNASSGGTASWETVAEVAENMKITLLACNRKEEVVVIRTAFFRGKMKKHRTGNSRFRG